MGESIGSEGVMPAINAHLAADLIVDGEQWPVFVWTIDHSAGRVLVDTGQPFGQLAVSWCDVRISVNRKPDHHQWKEQQPGGGPDAIPDCISHLAISSVGVVCMGDRLRRGGVRVDQASL